MLDIRLVRETPEIIKKDLEKRDRPDLLKKLEEVRKLDVEWRESLQEEQKLRHRRNILSQEVADLKKQGKDAAEKLKLVKDIPDKIKKQQEKTEELKGRIDQIMFLLPNILHESVPVGADDSQNKTIKTWGEKPKFDFPLKSHVDLLEEKGLADTAKASEIAGSRFYYLKNELVLLDYALLKFALDHLYSKGFILMEPPYMMRKAPYSAMVSMGDFEEVMYKVEGEDLYFIATSEHSIGPYHMNETLELKDLPLKYAGVSPCFRKEAGSHGKDTKGIFRVHHFHKVEQFVFSSEKDSWKLHEELLKNAEEIFQKLKLPYRVVNVCTGDMGGIAAKKYDIEVWMPAQKTYREAVSCSNCTDYQARRLNTKYQEGNDRKFVHTLNSTAIATSRAIVAIMENYQNKDGSFDVPKALHPYMPVKVIGKKK
ncbi:TPA: serine--tRNA ligase [Candidatus Woesearchaeota archaeon]|nr:Serine-tRNA ligase [archaeon GW2011_AR15]MBS3104445.1 serine--tRNA ligase [Candidatus Woesearchaeota archaeon]HIH41240.1 serine--tRNA ligase [Candidatus Woesearchaeota archaeon]